MTPFGKLLTWRPWLLRRLIRYLICRFGRKPPEGRHPTAAQESRIKRLFPDLRLWSVTGQATGPHWEPKSYNCIAWSVGITDDWIWPGDKVKDFDEFYSLHGWTLSESGRRRYKGRKIALYAKGAGPSDCTHASLETHDCCWDESKLGAFERIMHRRHEMEFGFYGNVIRYYEKSDDSANLDLRE